MKITATCPKCQTEQAFDGGYLAGRDLVYYDIAQCDRCRHAFVLRTEVHIETTVLQMVEPEPVSVDDLMGEPGQPVVDTSALDDPRMSPETERLVPRAAGAEVPASYEITCDHETCGRKWIMKEPMIGWHHVRCPGCTKSVSEAMWEKRRALPFSPTA